MSSNFRFPVWGAGVIPIPMRLVIVGNLQDSPYCVEHTLRHALTTFGKEHIVSPRIAEHTMWRGNGTIEGPIGCG
jgi:hypothetical protein